MRRTNFDKEQDAASKNVQYSHSKQHVTMLGLNTPNLESRSEGHQARTPGFEYGALGPGCPGQEKDAGALTETL
jgi:hypothetical protein